MRPQLARDGYGVALIGEALGENELREGLPFQGAAGQQLTRMLEWAGFDRSRFDIFNSVWCRPPGNRLEGEDYEAGAVGHCQTKHWGGLLGRSRVLVPMGNVPLAALGFRKGILRTRGYVRPYAGGDQHVVPTLHPSFIRRGNSRHTASFIHDIQKAVQIATEGIPLQFADYLLDPLPGEAYEWARTYRRRLDNDPSLLLAYDIETPGKGEDEGEVRDEDDPTYRILRIGFSYEPYTAMSIPFEPPYMAAIRMLMGSEGEKVVWNESFDNPRLRRSGVAINGQVHDGMVAWHVLHSDLPKGLGFVATFTCPFQPEWKHLSHARPAFYNATDADVELRSMLAIREELVRNNLWRVYERDVLELNPVLRAMEERGVPVDEEVRYDKAVKLAALQGEVWKEMEGLVPREARRWEPRQGFTREPEDKAGLIQITVDIPVPRCDRCGLVAPLKPHFRTFKKPTAKRPQNPCGGGGVVTSVEAVSRWARLVPFKPSRTQLLRYQDVMGRPTPMTRDKKSGLMKPTMNEQAIRKLMGKYKDDRLYPAVLRYRELDKLAGTYIGRPHAREIDDGKNLAGVDVEEA